MRGNNKSISQRVVFIAISALTLLLLQSLSIWQYLRQYLRGFEFFPPVEVGSIETEIIVDDGSNNKSSTEVIVANGTQERPAEGPTSISIPPSKMKIHYHELWNHTTSTIDVPEEYQNPFSVLSNETTTNDSPRKRRLTSLEILQNVLHGGKYQAEFEAVEAYMNGNSTTNSTAPSCLLPDVKATRKLANNVVRKRNERPKRITANGKRMILPLPVLNVGFPKVGSTTLADYFHCLGIRSSHVQMGKAFFGRLSEGEPLFRKKDRQYHVYAQLDRNFDQGYYPQIQLLDELHEVHPHSTLVLLARPIHDWIRSVTNWFTMLDRMALFRMPGLETVASQHGKPYHHPTDTQLAKWWCGHVLHIREYVREYPSHALIELDLYDTNETTHLLNDLFRADTDAYWQTIRNYDPKLPERPAQCWGQTNQYSNVGNSTAADARKEQKNDLKKFGFVDPYATDQDILSTIFQNETSAKHS